MNVRLSASARADALSAASDASRVCADDAKRMLSKELSGQSAAPPSPDGTYVFVPKFLAPSTSSPSDLQKLQAFLLSKVSDRRHGYSDDSSGSASLIKCVESAARGDDSKALTTDQSSAVPSVDRCSRRIFRSVYGGWSSDYLVGAFRKLKEDGTVEQKQLIDSWEKMSFLLLTFRGTECLKPEVKYYVGALGGMTVLDTATAGYVPGSYRFPIFSASLAIPAGGALGPVQQTRIGDQIRLRHWRLDVRIFCVQNAIAATPAIVVREYPVRCIAWRSKVDLGGLGAVDITGAAPTGSPTDESAILWDPDDTATRTGTAMTEDTSVTAPRSPNAVSKVNNRIFFDKTYHPMAASGSVGVAATNWQRSGGDLVTHIPVTKTYKGCGLLVTYQDSATTRPGLNPHFWTLITDLPPYNATIAPNLLYFSYRTVVYFTDA